MQSRDPIQVISPLEVTSRAGALIETFLGSSRLRGFQGYESVGGFGRMDFHHHAGNGFDIWYSRYAFAARDRFTSRAAVPVLELHFPLYGEFNSQWDGFHHATYKQNQFDLSYAPFIHHTSEMQAGQAFATFDIHYSKEYLQRFAYYPVMARFLEKVERGEPANLLSDVQFVTPAMLRLAREVLATRMDAVTAGYFYEASALLMLTLMLDRLSSEVKGPGYSSHDQDAAIYARDLITENRGHRYSIPELSKLSGINETKLQLCFKQLFGTTIFDYHQSIRLDYAANLLKTTPFTIQYIAEQCGYPDHSNLTTAFKKRFGCTPDFYRKHS